MFLAYVMPSSIGFELVKSGSSNFYGLRPIVDNIHFNKWRPISNFRLMAPLNSAITPVIEKNRTIMQNDI